MKKISNNENYVLKLVQVNADIHIEAMKKEFPGNKAIEVLETFTKLIIASTKEDLVR